MDSLKVTFDGADGAPLAARLEMPRSAPVAFALFAHCFTCGKDSSAAVRIARALATRDIAVLRFDFYRPRPKRRQFRKHQFLFKHC